LALIGRTHRIEEQALFQKFDQEEAETIEVGFKLDLLEDTLRLNGAVFSTDYKDLQFTYRVGVAPYLANAGEASIDGLELEATWVPNSTWMVQGGIGSLDTSIDTLRAIAGTGIGVSVGNALPFSPELQANIGIGYSGTITNGAVITPRVDIAYQDRTYFDANNTLEIAQLASVTIANLSVGYEPAGAEWQLVFGVNNATDERYPSGGNSSLTTGSGYAEIAYARPREFFLSFRNEF
jgi:iron complex outermembrane receptor protein